MNRCALDGWIGVVVVASVVSLPSTARADGPSSACLVDVTGNAVDDAGLRGVTEDTVRQLGNTIQPADPLEKALANPGSPGFSRDPAALEQARSSARLLTLVRVYSTGTTGRRGKDLSCEVLVFDKQGVHRAVGVLPAKDRPVALMRLIKQAWGTPAAPLSSLPPAAGTSAAAPAPVDSTAATPILADSTAASPVLVTSPAAAPAVDKIAMLDGTTLTGTIVEQKPGVYAIIKGADGSQSTITWSQIKLVTVAPRNAATGTATAGTATASASSTAGSASGGMIVNRENAGVDVSKGTATFSQQKGCPPGAPPEKCQEQLNAGFDANTRDASVKQIKNCADGTTGGSCTEQVQATAGPTSGLKVGYSKEEVTAVTTRPTSSTDFGLGAGFQYGTGAVGGSDLTLLGFSGDLTIDRIMGGRLPGKEGGSWSGFFLEPKASIQFMSITAEGLTGSMVGFAAGGTAGWQYFKFESTADDTLKQGGFGFRAGAYAGYTWFQSSIEVMGMTFEDSTDQTSYGPSLGFTKLDYNPGTADVRRTDLNLFILPTGDFTFFLVQANKSW